MNARRARHTATLLPSGEVLIAGGFSGGYCCFPVTSGAEIYSPNTNSFRPGGAMLFERLGHTAVLLKDGRVLIAGGGYSTASQASAELYTTAPVSVPTTTYSLWDDKKDPTIKSDPDSRAIEVGVKFKADIDGVITAICFYKGTQNTGIHTVSLWSGGLEDTYVSFYTDGVLLGRSVSSNETESGWQQINLSPPVNISANKTYIASYHTTSGHYSFNSGYFYSQYDNAPLHALADASRGYSYVPGNGVWQTNAWPTFPSHNYLAGNFWVDVVFSPRAAPTAPDTTAPVIAGISVTNSTSSGGTINWSTNEPADGQIEFLSPCPSTGCLTAIASTLATSHAIAVGNLNAATTYAFRIRSKDATGNLATADSTLTTLPPPAPPPPGPPPSVSNLAAVCNGATRVTLSWSAAPTATSYYLRVNDLSHAASTPLDYLVDDYKQTSFIANVLSGHDYVWWVHSANSAGLSRSTQATFSCPSAAPLPPDNTPPVISAVSVTNITSSGGTINWSTNEPADGQIEFISPCPSTGCLTATASTLVTSHTIAVGNLNGATTYAFRIRSKDAAGNLATADSTLTTSTPPAPPLGPPPSPSNIAAVCNGATKVTLSWSAAPTAISYYLRVNDLSHAASTPLDYVVDDYKQTSFIADVQSGHSYVWWVHSANAAGLSRSTQATFSCP